ncbi:MAG: anhydro-N-acetylmuramic acid kinase [Alphaproteobacteria bacterium]|nr:anhydro-N-acetylmuramic acid kinase [Alphaproteobacteria bacterium]
MLRAIGLMSGTSMDGIDVALIETDGEDVVRRRADCSIDYAPGQRKLIADALVEASSLTDRVARPPALANAETEITNAHIEAVKGFMEGQGLGAGDVDVVGFHGQTVIHKPDERFTVQIGDGEKLAQALGIQTVFDLRAADVHAGGQGAPFAPVYHRALAQSLEASPAVFVNIGGVSNVTYIGTDGELIAFDTGPGNALLDDWVLQHTGTAVDLDGAYAASGAGQFDGTLLKQMLANPYFDLAPPKSLDRNDFSAQAAEGLPLEAGAALLTAFTAASLQRSAEWFPEAPKEWVICGGGRKNPELMRQLNQRLGASGARISVPEDYGFNGDSVEAEAFAYLAVRSLRGLPLSFPGTTGCPEPLTGGVLCRV